MPDLLTSKGALRRALTRCSRTPGWPVMNPGAFGGQKAHGVGDVAGSSPPPGGHRGQIGLPELAGNVGVAFYGDESGRDRVRGDAERGQFADPAEGQADLRALGGGTGRPARRRPVGDLEVDVHNPVLRSPGVRARDSHTGEMG